MKIKYLCTFKRPVETRLQHSRPPNRTHAPLSIPEGGKILCEKVTLHGSGYANIYTNKHSAIYGLNAIDFNVETIEVDA